MALKKIFDRDMIGLVAEFAFDDPDNLAVVEWGIELFQINRNSVQRSS